MPIRSTRHPSPSSLRRLAPALVLLLAGAGARADLGPLEPLADFHRAVHEALGLPEPLIVRLLERGLPEPELPVVGLLAEQARVPVDRVADWRLRGDSYLDISHRLGVSPAIFYVPFERDPGPPYGKAWGYYRKTPRAEWSRLRLPDRAFVDLANVKLCTRYYGVSPQRVAEVGGGHRDVGRLHRELHAHGHGKPGRGDDHGRSKHKEHGKPPHGHGRPPG